jgi:hypothetical protein
MAVDLPLDLQVRLLPQVGFRLGRVDKPTDPPPWDRHLDIRLLPWRSGNQPKGRLVRDAWKTESAPREGGLHDLALLRVVTPLPKPKKYWGIYSGARIPRSTVTIFAFPEGQPAR